jgi:hypothetical protein
MRFLGDLRQQESGSHIPLSNFIAWFDFSEGSPDHLAFEFSSAKKSPIRGASGIWETASF